MTIGQVPTLANPTLFDAAILPLRTHLVTELSWLNIAYGKSELRVNVVNGQPIRMPSVYTGKQEYMLVFPEDHQNNFCFFDVEDGEELQTPDQAGYVKLKMGIVFWFDYRKIYPDDWQNQSIENVKKLVLDALRLPTNGGGAIRLKKVYHEADNIYKGYTHKEIKQQFLMRPYGGFRIECEFKYMEHGVC